jgi:hypothetical protein
MQIQQKYFKGKGRILGPNVEWIDRIEVTVDGEIPQALFDLLLAGGVEVRLFVDTKLALNAIEC